MSGFLTGFAKASHADWEKRVAQVLKGAAFETLNSQTADGIAIAPLYEAKPDALPVPGMRTAKPWHVCVRVDHPAAAEAARQALADLEGGADALTLVFAGSRSARGFGLQPDSVLLDEALAGVDLQLITLRLDAGLDAEPAIEAMAALTTRRNLSPDMLDIDFGYDPIGAMAAGGNFDAIDLAACPKLLSRLRDKGFSAPVLRVDGRVWHEAGAGEAQELGAMLATGIAYLRALETGDRSLDEARAALSFLAVADADEFMTIAKMRALRRLWARIEQACGLEPRPIRLHAETAWRMLTKRDPHSNLLRNTIAVFAAGVGGADGVTVLPFTAALGLPDARARRIARNTQSVLIEEANLWRVSDPTAGAGGFEALTEALCEKGWTLFQEIEREGGILASLKAGHLQQRVATVRYARVAAIAAGERPVIGTTRFPLAHEAHASVLNVAAFAADALPDSALSSVRLSEPFEGAMS